MKPTAFNNTLHELI